MNAPYRSFAEFYPFYLSQHRDLWCRRLHVLGTALVILTALYAAGVGQWRVLWLLPLLGYGFAWIGHFVFEKNQPATFRYPRYSLMGDFVMFKDILVGKIKF